MMDAAAELAIVTGASSGIGAEYARQLSAQGIPVLAVARRAARLEELRARALSLGHASIHPLELDVTDAGAAMAIRDRARELGRTTWLINNAGSSRVGRFVDAPAGAHVGLLRLNCEAIVEICAAVVPEMIASGGGRVINVASLAAFQPTPMQAMYGATKAFVLSFSEALSEELRGTGVTVNALCPGPVTTEIFEHAAAGYQHSKTPHELSVESCVAASLASVRRGSVVFVPGALNKMVSVWPRMAPRSVIRRISSFIGLKYIGLQLPSKRVE